MEIKGFCKDFVITYALFCFFGVPVLNRFVINVPHEKYKEQLEVVLNSEKKKWNIEDKIIEISFNDSIINSGSSKIKDNNYLISLARGQRNERLLKHEVYHVAKGHCDRHYLNVKTNKIYNLGIRFFDYTFVTEPAATIYSLTGLKL
jgi:hypothetical protein